MKLRLSTLMLALSLGSTASLALAEAAAAPAPAATPAPETAPMGMGDEPHAGPGPQGGHHAMREKLESFTEESTRKMADGRVFKRQVEQKVGEGSFYHKEVITNPDGKTASRTVTATLNKDKKMWTRKMEGVDFDGTTWNRTQDVPAPQAADAGKAPAAKRPERKKGN